MTGLKFPIPGGAQWALANWRETSAAVRLQPRHMLDKPAKKRSGACHISAGNVLLYRNQSFGTKLKIVLAQDGVIAALKWSVGYAIHKIGLKDGPTKRRLEIARRLEALYNSTVAYGPFKGLTFASGSWWGDGDKSGMMLGLYEQELLQELERLSGDYKTFIDLGAADGYYGVGVLVGGLFDQSICYEASAKGRASIAQNAKRNNVADRVTIRGYADKGFYTDIPEDARARSVLFIDIEGGEFSLLTDDVLDAFSQSVIFIELHDWFFDTGAEQLAQLKARAARRFRITALEMGARDLSPFPELAGFSDDDRWLICSEGRAQAMTWLRLDPLDAS